MKKIGFVMILSLWHLSKVYSQQEENIWTFGNHAGLDFSNPTPVLFGNYIFPGWGGTASICNSSGSLLLYTNGFWVWNRNHEIMPYLTGGIPGYSAPLAPNVGYPPMMPWNGAQATQATTIARMPADTNKYVVFSLSTGGQLYYSVIDMTLDGGLGDIVPGKKSIVLTSGLTEKMTVVKGCNNIWLITRALNSNQYRAFEIRDTAINTVPVISNSGNLPVSWYRFGVIKFSPDGTKMAAACNRNWNSTGGLELYDFDKHTGIISNAQVLDSSSTIAYYYGACFSPDNSKLYTTVSSFSYQNTFYAGKVRQFDLSLPSIATIIASNTIVFTDPYSNADRLGDLKRGLDNKIYFVSGNGSPNIHVINAPNTAGLASNPVADVIMSPLWNIYRPLPNDVAVLPFHDTIKTSTQIVNCFKDSISITSDTGKHHVWHDGTAGRSRTITRAGTYTVRYTNLDCKNQEDTFKVAFFKLPVLSHSLYSCPEAEQATARLLPSKNDTTTFYYTWMDHESKIIRQNRSNNGDSLTRIDPGKYAVHIRTAGGCDTTLSFHVLPIPIPEAGIVADSVTCTGRPIPFSFTGTAPLWHWDFGDGTSSDAMHPVHLYRDKGIYTVSLWVTNIEGCSHTVFKEVIVNTLQLELNASRLFANIGEEVALSTHADEPYVITSWEPAYLFADQSLRTQDIFLDTTRMLTVTGVSENGCESSASVKVEVKPIVIMPNAFSPNNDGINDRFHPASSGFILIRNFEVYNRLGQIVYSAFGASAIEGWDGTSNGKPCDMGAYFYQLHMETAQGETIHLKGDVSLIR